MIGSGCRNSKDKATVKVNNNISQALNRWAMLSRTSTKVRNRTKMDMRITYFKAKKWSREAQEKPGNLRCEFLI